MLLTAAVAAGPAGPAEEPFTLEFDKSALEAGFLSGLKSAGLSGPSSIEGTIDEEGEASIRDDGF